MTGKGQPLQQPKRETSIYIYIYLPNQRETSRRHYHPPCEKRFPMGSKCLFFACHKGERLDFESQ